MHVPPGETLFTALKSAAGLRGPPLVLPVGSPPAAVLRPVPTRTERLNATDIRCLTDWRNRHVGAFLTEFVATVGQTARWLATTVGPDPTRILFMLDDLGGEPIGYMGLAFIDWEERSAEADAVVRGRPDLPGIMRPALNTLLAWASGQGGLVQFKVRVRSDNPALDFYGKIGFRETHRVPLRQEVHPEKLLWVEDPTLTDAVLHLVHLRLPRPPNSDCPVCEL